MALSSFVAYDWLALYACPSDDLVADGLTRRVMPKDKTMDTAQRKISRQHFTKL